ncbi:MAG: M20 family metallopeptidase [Candidatus Omnitrophica bacterium]|jgi:succinyl-diaminopimelate desuccinylase|nr:M20 family metallopeptidase [Candidatus Omnitrophota bacterium]
MVNKKRLIQTIKKLISLDSQNPPGDERKVADFVSAYLKTLGLKVRTYTFSDKRVNVLATLKGSGRANSLLLTPHLDTVPAGKNWKTNPFAAKISGDRVYGLGATDCKGNLASLLEAVNSIVEDGIKLDYDLIFAATADEESGSSLGLIPLLERKILKPSAAVVLDADDFEIVVTQKGLMHLKVYIRGRKAHGAYPWLGINAIDIAAQVIVDLKKQRASYKKNKYLRQPTINVGTISGGDKVNVVSDWCEFELDFRFLPGESEKKLLDSLRKTISKYTKDFRIEIQGIQAPYSINPGHPLVKGLASAMKDLKISPRISGSEGATVITFFKLKNIPAVATGFGTESCAHVADEYACLSNLYKGAQVLVSFLKNYKFNRS